MLVAPFQSTPVSRQPPSDQHLTTAITDSAPFITPARLLTFDGVDESPSDQHPNNLHTSYCPLCMQYFEGVYETTCCGQNICGGCGTGLVREGAKKAAPLQAMLSFVPATTSSSSTTAVARRQQERDEERAMRQQLLLSALNMNLVLDTPYFKEECVLNVGARLPRPTSVVSGSSASDVDSRSSSQAADRRPSTDGSSKFSNFSINVSKVATLVSVVCPYCFRFLKVRPCEKKVCAPLLPTKLQDDATPLKRTTTVEGFQSHSPQLGGIHSSSPSRDESSDPTSLMSPSPSGQLGGRVGGRRAMGPYSSLYSSNSPSASSPRVDLNHHSPLGATRLRPLDGSLQMGQSSSPYPLSVRGGVYGRASTSSSMPAGPASRYVRQARIASASPHSPSVDSDEDFSIGDSASLRTNPAAATLSLSSRGQQVLPTPSPEATEPAGGGNPSTPLSVNPGHRRRSAMMEMAPSTPSPRGQLRSHARVPRLSTLTPEVSLTEPVQRAAAVGRRVPPLTTHQHARSHNDTVDSLRPELFEADTFVGPQTARGLLRAPPPLPPPVSSPRRVTDVASPYLLRRLPARSADTSLPTISSGTPGRSLPVAAAGPSPVRAGDDFGEMQRKLMLQLTTNATYRSQFTVDFEGLQTVERNMPRPPARSLPPLAAAPPPAPPAARDTSLLPPIASSIHPPRRQVGGRRRGSSTTHVTAPVIASSSRQGSARSASQPTVPAQRRALADAAAAKEDRWCPVM